MFHNVFSAETSDEYNGLCAYNFCLVALSVANRTIRSHKKFKQIDLPSSSV